MAETVSNPGSALCEAIGSWLEAEIHRTIEPIQETQFFLKSFDEEKTLDTSDAPTLLDPINTDDHE